MCKKKGIGRFTLRGPLNNVGRTECHKTLYYKPKDLTLILAAFSPAFCQNFKTFSPILNKKDILTTLNLTDCIQIGGENSQKILEKRGKCQKTALKAKRQKMVA